MSRRVWSKREDEKLTALVTQFGDRRGKDGKWAEISKQLPGRTNKDCRKRWFHSLDPSLKKGPWTEEEDKILLEAHGRLGPAWKEIGRKDDQCAKRYNDILNPLAKDRLKDWSPEEDQYLAVKVDEIGHRWAKIAAGLPGRPPLTCRNRWRKLSKNLSAMSSLSSSDLASSSDALPSSISASTSPSRLLSHTPSQVTDLQTPMDSRRIESDFSHLSPAVSGSSVLFPMNEIDSSALENSTEYQELLIGNSFTHNHRHNEYHENVTQRSNPLCAERNTDHDVTISGQQSTPTTLPQQGDYNQYGAFWELLAPVNGNQDTLSSIFPGPDAQSEPRGSTSGMQDQQRTSIEEAAMLQALSSTTAPLIMPNHALTTKNPAVVQEVQHHHHIHHHHYHHHYHHYE